ncbi:E3 ubiquitin-protein ligase mib1-like [Histomonas meleagridis]|uniref:E3 ubiquitin-protein ligase mib1-like n=1 Tax=Histomonas meleagridis TaxID=135588 RepID=UPI00355A268D|nr:E3 ubiquitin-protein ligase mib1-like [Histomonas meleagridis]KAH0806530.1 E3 ubiquitin-protein ligase mib1-like [Histomonas meleagridis]
MNLQAPTSVGLSRNSSVIYQSNFNANHGPPNISRFQSNMNQDFRLPPIEPPPDLPLPLAIYQPSTEDEPNQNEQESEDQNHQHTCMNCGRNIATLCCVPCGHQVICQQCSNDISLSNQNQLQPQRFSEFTCPLCDTPVQCFSRIYKSETCCICYTYKPNTVFFPCGHQCICDQCLPNIWNQKKTCPICQQKASSCKQQFDI